MRLLLTFLITSTVCLSQPPTGINTKQQAENFIRENFKYYDFKYYQFVIDSVDSYFDNFRDGDFNHDGIKDLLIFGTAHVVVKKDTFKRDEIVIILGGKKRPRKVNFPYGSFRSLMTHIIPYPKVIRHNNKDLILITYDIVDYREHTSETFRDTLFVRNDHVIPFTEYPSNNVVTRVEFKTDHCYGTCPVFEMTIDENLDVVYNGIDHVDKKGEFKLKALRKDWGYITELIRNLNIQDLKDNYSVRWTDDQTGFLTVHFKNGDKKQIEDYGLSGTFGLSVLYDYFFELRKF